MTTPQAKIQPAAQRWEPFPELPREPKDMLQTPASNYLREVLQSILAPGVNYPYHPTILVCNEVPIYYDPNRPATGGPPPHVIPDCLVAFDVDTDAIWRRVGYDPLQNGKPPEFVIEVASRHTHRNDTNRKREIYRQIGVPEYWRFDAENGRYFGHPIIGEGLVNGQYERFPLIRYDNGAEGSTSAILNLNFRWWDGRFSIHNPATGEEYEHPQEANARLTAEIRRLRGEG
jgi:Uma2 family endonuclease